MSATVIVPTSEQAVAEALTDAASDRRTVVVRGGGTKQTWGLPPDPDATVLETRGIAALVDIEPGDFVCVAQAGMRLVDLQATLAENREYRQRLMLDPSHGDRQTLGGILAANASGPLRHRYGAPRDLVLGARFVLSDGTIARSGGRVVKNVAGYDIARLLAGSLGTLAVVTELCFKLHPVPEASETVVLQGDSDELVGFARTLRTAPVDPSCVELLWPDRVLAVRIDSSLDGAAAQARRVLTLRSGSRRLDPDEARAFWEALRGRPYGDDGIVVGFGIPPAELRRLLQFAETAELEIVMRAGIGTGETRLVGGRAALERFRTEITRRGGYVSVRRAASEPVADLVWPARDPVAFDLMRAVKHQLDPADTLGRERLWMR